jgi:hypothetical protein
MDRGKSPLDQPEPGFGLLEDDMGESLYTGTHNTGICIVCKFSSVMCVSDQFRDYVDWCQEQMQLEYASLHKHLEQTQK